MINAKLVRKLQTLLINKSITHSEYSLLCAALYARQSILENYSPADYSAPELSEDGK